MSGLTARRALALPAALLSVGLITAACGSSSTSSKPVAGSTGSADSSSVLGPDNAATGTPVKVGFISEGRTAAIDTTAEIEAAKVSAEYANKKLGGLGGHPIELDVCEEKGTPAGGQACGNQFVQDKVVAVAGAGPSFIDAVAKVVQPAGVPVVLHRAATPFTLTTPGIFVFGNPLYAFSDPAAFAKEKGAKSAALIVIDVPGVTGAANTLGKGIFGNAGATTNVVAIPPGTADMTPQVQGAASKKPDVYYVLGDPTFCGSALRAIKTLAITAPLMVADNCVTSQVAKSIPGGFANTTVAVQAVLDPADNDVKILAAALKTYGDGQVVDTFAAGGFQAIIGLVRAVGPTLADATPAGVLAAIKGMGPQPYPFAKGATFQCTGKVLAVAPNACSTYGIIADGTSGADFTNYRTVDASQLLKLG